MAHTRGPWGISAGIEIWIKAGSVHVATIPRAPDGDWSEDNANLIAASPDLLSAAKRVLEVSVMGGHAAEQLRAAINKAEGRA